MDETSHSSDAGERKDTFARAMGHLDRLRDAVVRSSQIGKIKLNATFLRRERDRLVKELGEEALNLMLSDRLATPPELAALVSEVRLVEQKIEADGQQMDQIMREGLATAR